MMYGQWNGGFWHMGWMGLGWILVALLVLVGVWALARTAGAPRANGASPGEILRKRYARGEIDRDTYERMRRELEE